MRAHEDVKAVLDSLGLPCALQAFPVGGAPDPPFCVFTADDYDELYADGEVFGVIVRFEVGLYERDADAGLEGRVYDALTDRFGTVARDEAWVESEHMRVVWYSFDTGVLTKQQ